MFKLKHVLTAVIFHIGAIHLAAIQACAHTDSQTILNFTATKTATLAEFELPLGELSYALGLDRNGDGDFTLEELHRSGSAISAYLDSRIKLVSESDDLTKQRPYVPCERSEYRFRTQKKEPKTTAESKSILGVALDYRCGSSVTPYLYYDALFDTVPNHSALVSYQNGDDNYSYILSGNNLKELIPLKGKNMLSSILSFVVLGVWHILIGYDHILFVLALIIPVSAVRNHDRQVRTKDVANLIGEILKVVTAFTLAHSISLIAATLGLIELPSALVEMLIAVSLVVAGLSILFPFTYSKRWLAAFGFGFIHGFGFANVLAELIESSNNIVADLLAFNVGVEVGQLVIIAATLPVLFLMQGKSWYRRIVIPSGAISIALMGAFLTVQRL